MVKNQKDNDMKKLLFAVALLSITACHKKSEPVPNSAALPIEVTTPIVREITLTREYPGYLKADATIPIMGRVNGSIIKRNFTEGSRVKKGDLLFVIEPTLYENAVAQAQASLQTAIAEQEYARSNYERMQVAISSNAVSEIELLQAKRRVESSNASVATAKAALNSAQTPLRHSYIEAPADGSVGLAKQPVGAYVAGEMSPVELCQLYKDDLMYAFFDIPDIQWFRKALATNSGIDQSNISFTLGEGNIIERNATIDYLAPNVNTGTGTLQIRAELPNNDGLLKSGSYISIIMPYDNVKDALLIKDASIGTDQTGKFIYVVNDSNEVEYRRIETGSIIDDTLCLVTGGIEPGERYVTKALLKVRNGMSVTPIME